MDRLGLEAPPGFEPGMEVLQTSALPLGDGAGRTRLYEGIRPRDYVRLRQREERQIVFIVRLRLQSSAVRLRATRYGGTTSTFGGSWSGKRDSNPRLRP